MLVGNNNGSLVSGDDVDTQNLKFDYQKMRLFDKMRKEGVSEANMNAAVLLLKKNYKNLNKIS